MGSRTHRGDNAFVFREAQKRRAPHFVSHGHWPGCRILAFGFYSARIAAHKSSPRCGRASKHSSTRKVELNSSLDFTALARLTRCPAVRPPPECLSAGKRCRSGSRSETESSDFVKVYRVVKNGSGWYAYEDGLTTRRFCFGRNTTEQIDR